MCEPRPPAALMQRLGSASPSPPAVGNGARRPGSRAEQRTERGTRPAGAMRSSPGTARRRERRWAGVVREKTATVRGQTAAVRGKTAAVWRQTVTVRGQTATVWRQTATVWGRTATVWRQTATVRGRTATVMGRTAAVMGKTAIVLGRTVVSGAPQSPLCPLKRSFRAWLPS